MQEFIRDALKVLLGVGFLVAAFKTVHILGVSDKERQNIRRRAYGDAMDAWAAVREDDYRHYKKQLRKLQAEIEERDAIIAEQKEKLERWEVIGQAAVSGKGGKLK